MLVRALGSSIVDEPQLQTDVISLLGSQEDVELANHFPDPNRVTIEALFTHCHSEDGSARVGMSEVASMATAIMADCGETAVVEPKRMGVYLRLLGFRPKRDSKGFAIHLTAEVRRMVHKLVYDYQVEDSVQIAPGCPQCTELMSIQSGSSTA